ncbi:shikimate dehydrogenase [Pseudooceanicola sp. 216_PA32_1]|uniref:Shikimate dehydrogenase n=1 Tax=Pseudooceanicola pacificus TaxID=2676438 RepID=A0A844W8I3_9RHOB|nr:shikimate dehydrogenase [Pseudooceanicola pacificus]MWB79144.1 shikimate dehydrogenase [Pseudooceanicola pacificus]
MTDSLKLGLIGDNIARSRSPLLHRLAGAQHGIGVTYDRLVPNQLDQDFAAVFEGCRTGGYRGINVTYPYKEIAAPMVRIDDPMVRAIGAVNTVIFGKDGPRGYNTDHTGFMAAYRSVLEQAAPGTVLMIGTGGVGRAVAFGLIGLGVRALRLVDRDPAKAEALAQSLQEAAPDTDITIWDDGEKAAEAADGLINCTPVGMVGYEGTPLPAAAMKGASWAFDAVYTPADTQFLTDAAAAGLSVLSGWELFFHQGVHAWALFSGFGPDETELRSSLMDMGAAA